MQMSVDTVPVLPTIKTHIKRTFAQKRTIDRWFVALLLLSVTMSCLAAVYSYYNQFLLLNNDSYAHLSIARRVIDSAFPGVAQLGGVWLPLPHLILAPFVQIDFLFSTGLAGTIPSMILFVIATVYLYKAALELTGSGVASFVGSLVFVLNPNILYLQTTPLTEPLLYATIAMTTYYFILWVHTENMRYLFLTATATLLATLSRYEGWGVFVFVFVGILAVLVLRRRKFGYILGSITLFGFIGGIGIIFWLVWCELIFGNPLYFQTGPYSSQVQQAGLLQNHLLDTYHNIPLDIKTWGFAVGQSSGPLLCILAILGIVIMLFRHNKFLPEFIAAATTLVPTVFYLLTLYTGTVVIYVPGAYALKSLNHYYDGRYSTEAELSVALFVAVVANRRWLEKAILPLLVTLAQSVQLFFGGVIALQTSQFGLECHITHQTTIYLAQYYRDGALVLQDGYFNNNPDMVLIPIPYRYIIYQGSKYLWDQALQDPANTVEWILVSPGDKVSKAIIDQGPAFFQRFREVSHDSDGRMLFHRIGPDLGAPRPVPDRLTKAFTTCDNSLVAAKKNEASPWYQWIADLFNL